MDKIIILDKKKIVISSLSALNKKNKNIFIDIKIIVGVSFSLYFFI